ncbi:DUF4349 domain-containing protein [Microbacterium oleivorans]|uniref:DUF4349 domain-containing protein n=1 Tax=Microbacterium oleivorans TaxID=273677 RepID=A0A7D5EUW9_9MICO|nr:DUF4349 domain-containing protein [Microbacterium oleivorans]QLD10324.1 DUF4349 domain-containing protein [Microbacterium oleivorans]
MTELPTLEDRRIDEIEHELFAEIARERADRQSRDAAAATARRRRRRTWWGASAAAAAVLVAAAAVGPQLIGSGAGSAGSAAPASDPGWTVDAPADGDAAPDQGITSQESAPVPGDGSDLTDASVFGADDRAGEVGATTREVVATASASVVVTDPRAAAQSIADAAAAAGGYVESLSVGGGASPTSTDMTAWPAAPGDAWVSVRVPAADLQSVLDGLSEVGEVKTSQVSRDDVTTQAIDLRARVAAGQASVDRLTALLSESGSVADLIAAESALAARQADLESLQQQLTALESQVALSSLTVQLTEPERSVDADPAGFGDGLGAGWNGLVATFNALVVGLGFLLPWLAVLGLTATLVWLTVRATRRRRAR